MLGCLLKIPGIGGGGTYLEVLFLNNVGWFAGYIIFGSASIGVPMF
jgi:hypothetical protein